MSFLKNFFSSITSLTLVDLIFFVAVIVLIILVVTLIYFIKINEDETEAVLDILPSYDEVPDNEKEELIDLQSISKALEERKNNPIDMTEYEQEQEERAIISYEELLEKSKNLALNYEKEEINEDLIIKKVDLDNLVGRVEEEKACVEVRVISYQKEEAFLEALKKLKEQIS